MYQTREIIYDYKIRIEWGKERRRAQRLRWALAMAAPVAVALLGGMASHQIRTHEFHLPPWGELFEKPDTTAERVLRIPVEAASTLASAAPSSTLLATLEPVSHPFTPQHLPESKLDLPLDPVPLAEEPMEQPLAAEAAALEEDSGWQTVTVRRGDNLSLIFDRLGLSGTDLDRIIGLGGDTSSLKHLSPDDNLRFRISRGTLEEMVHEIDLGHTLYVRNHDGAFTAETVAESLEPRIVHAIGHIKSSLFEAGQSAGLSDATIMQMAEIFDFDIDLVLDIREGDRFSVVYEEIYKDGKKVKDGHILAAEFVNQGKSYRAVRYEDEDGHPDYFRPDGQSLRRAFIRTPVAFTRITSRFNLQRKHPILNRIRAHKGVDYAAPTGTPVKATGDARVATLGWQGGYGRVIMLEHQGGYTTVYGHLSAYAKGLKVGSRVRLGQTIGYVGQSGLATGPHLHYEFRVKGVHRDPLKVALPKTMPVAREKLADFKAKTREAVAMLEQVSSLAAADTTLPAAAAEGGAATAASPPQNSKPTTVARAPH